MSSVSRTRATNLTGLIDIDSLVEANLLRQKTKINTATQKMKVEQYKQEQYREVITKSKKFYNKYCDILSGGNLLSSSSYNAMKATSSDSSSVTATVSTKASAGNYKVNVTQVATSAQCEITSDTLMGMDKITINNQTFTLNGTDAKSRASDLSSQLEKAGIGVNAKYSNFANNGNGGLIIQTEATGKDAELVIGNGNTIDGISITPATIKTTDSLTNTIANGDILTINGEAITLSNDRSTIDTTGMSQDKIGALTDEDVIMMNLTKSLADKGLDKIEASYDTSSGLKISTKEAGSSPELQVSYNGGAIANVTGGNEAISNDVIDYDAIKDGQTLVINGKSINITVDSADDNEAIKNKLNIALTDAKIGVQINSDSKLQATAGGGVTTFTAGIRNNSNNLAITSGKDTEAKITDMSTGMTYTHTGSSNSVTLDEVTFNFTDKTNGDVTIGVKADGTELKDKIVEFINDYNELLGHINGKLYEEYDRSYLPLTDEDKEGLSDSEIEKLEKKAQTGLLKNDSYLRNFADDMKMTMSTVLTSGQNKGLSLEKIGIKPVEDYSTQNGLFTIDEDKLLSAIEENPDGIKELFSGKDGIVTKLSDNLKDHATGTFSRLAKKAGVADGVTANTNEMTKDIEERKKLITQMQTALQEKEDALYTKYSTLESNLASLQSQQSSLSSYFQ